MELYAKDGHIVDLKTGKTLGLIHYFDNENENHLHTQQLFASAPKMLESLKLIHSILSDWSNARGDGKYRNEILHLEQTIQTATTI